MAKFGAKGTKPKGKGAAGAMAKDAGNIKPGKGKGFPFKK